MRTSKLEIMYDALTHDEYYVTMLYDNQRYYGKGRCVEMPSLKMYVGNEIDSKKRVEIEKEVKQRFAQLPSAIRNDAVLAVIECQVVSSDNADPYWLEVKCSKNTHSGEVVQIANYFVDVIDVEAYDPVSGAFVFKPKGSDPLTSL